MASFYVICTFDLKNASSGRDYQNAYSDLRQIGLYKVVVAANGNSIVMPTTTTTGTFTGSTSQQVSADVATSVKAAFSARRLTSEIYVLAMAADTAYWNAATT